MYMPLGGVIGPLDAHVCAGLIEMPLLFVNSKDILQEYAELTDRSTPEFSQCYTEIYKAANGLHASSEYDAFLETDK